MAPQMFKRHIKKLSICGIALGILAYVMQADATTTLLKPKVRVLAWIGYIKQGDPYIKQIENECGVQITHTEYTSNLGFLNFLRNPEYPYDIAIFSSAIYNLIAKDIANPHSTLYETSKHYYPIIRQHYLKGHYAHNVVFFSHAMTGFVYNPHVIPSLPTYSISQMFHKAQGKYVVMINSPIEAGFLLHLAKQEKTSLKKNFDQSPSLAPLDPAQFKHLYQGTNFIITNTPERIVTFSNFAFAFQWSGDAFQMLLNNPGRLKYFIHPHLSYVSSDLLANLVKGDDTSHKNSSHYKRVRCVSTKLASKWFLNHEQNVAFYFSPYGGDQQINNPEFKKLYHVWIKHLPKLPWIRSVNKVVFNQLIKTWDKIKFEVSAQDHPDN